MKTNDKKPIRSEENTKMTISLPVKLLEKIDSNATKDRRNRSQWLVLELEKLIEKLESETSLKSVESTQQRQQRKAK